MEIELNTNRLSSVSPASPPQKAREAAPAGDEANFSGTQALAEALAHLPETRPEVIQRARELVGSAKYPPDDMLNRIARLVAMELPNRTE